MSTRSNSPYVPTYLKAAVRDARSVVESASDAGMSETNVASDSSFKYDPLDYPIKSTQQLNVDWSSFENHTFFSSAEVKVNEAFNLIINGFPFDGTKQEVEAFFDKMTGFEKWVFDEFPTFAGALHFSGTQIGENPSGGYAAGLGTWIDVKDKTGILFPTVSKNKLGISVINPAEENSMTIEMQLYLPNVSNDRQVIVQKSSGSTQGFHLHLEPSSASTVTAVFSVTSGSNRNNVSGTLSKGAYNHVAVVLNKEDQREHFLQFYVNEQLQASSSESIRFGHLDIDESDLLIGSGSAFYSKTGLVTPTQTLSGTMDELRIFHSVRTPALQTLYAGKGLYASSDLKAYYRFNEPPPPLSLYNNDPVNGVVLDSSGNSLHAYVSNFTGSLRVDASTDALNPVTDEKQHFKTILFPAHADVVALNASLLTTAKDFDRNNPNIITRLVPEHYLLEGASQEGYSTIEGNSRAPYGGSGVPGQGKMGSSQIILTFLHIWSKFFDEMKMYIDAFGTLRTVGYDTVDTMPDNFLEDAVRANGFYLPKFFNNSTIEQYAEGASVDGLSDIGIPLKKIQATIVRRVLVNMLDITRSKGTQHSIRSFLRSVGIDPDNSLRIREYGGPTTKRLSSSREKKMSPVGVVDFTTSSLVVTPFLSASRTEPGWPHPAGTFVLDPVTSHPIASTVPDDGLLTSGSWTVEGVFKFPPQKLDLVTDPDRLQSLFRVCTTGSSPAASPGLLVNVIAAPGVDHPFEVSRVTAYVRPGGSTSSPLLTMHVNLSGAGVFDGNRWNVSVGRQRSDEIDSVVSSSYFLRVGKADAGDIEEIYVTSSFLLETPLGELNAFQSSSTTLNASGSYVALGKNQSIPYSITYPFLNDSLNVPAEARTTDFVGRASNVRMWSKSTSIDEWKEHVRNPNSLGVEDPYTNYNFVSMTSGSFGKLRLDTMCKQPVTTANALGNIDFLDFSLNFKTPTAGSGFSSGSTVIVGDVFMYSFLSPSFDEATVDDAEKIRIRSFNDPVLIAESPLATATPTYLNAASFAAEQPNDDLRLSIEFSMVDSLDRDIVNMLSSLDVINDAIGSPEMMFSSDYPDLERLRDVYFNRLSSRMDFRRFLEFYKWFDFSVSSFVEQLIPSKTRYKGTNFVIESHMLERHKTVYRHDGAYKGQKQVIDDSLLVQQLAGMLKKY